MIDKDLPTMFAELKAMGWSLRKVADTIGIAESTLRNAKGGADISYSKARQVLRVYYAVKKTHEGARNPAHIELHQVISSLHDKD